MKTKYKFIIASILIFASQISLAQIGANLTPIRPASPGFQLGWNGVGGNSGSLEIKNDFNDDINFSTNTNPQAKLDANGNFSIGQTSTTNYFGIGTTTPVLWHNGNTADIFVGVNAGNNFMGGHSNTFVGNGTGTVNTTGHDNTFIGHNAGNANIGAAGNTFVGGDAGLLQTGGGENTYVGWGSGSNNLTGSENAYLGVVSGQSNQSGIGNTCMGYASGRSNLNNFNSFYGFQSGVNTGIALSTTEGVQNSFMGANSGFDNVRGSYNSCLGTSSGINNIIGDSNTFVGHSSGTANLTTVNFSTAVGANAIVITDHTMILGDNPVNVGIGLSGIAGGPLAKLHVLRDISLIPVTDPTGVRIDNTDLDALGAYGGNSFGLTVTTIERNLTNFGGFFTAEEATTNIGARFETLGAFAAPSNQANKAGIFNAENGDSNYGIESIVTNGKFNFGVHVDVSNASALNMGALLRSTAGPTTFNNYGVSSVAWPGLATNFNVAIYGNAPVNPPLPPLPPPFVGTWAGYFNGDLGYTGTLYIISDSTLKTNIEPLTADTAASILSQLNTYSYYFDTLQLQGSANVSKNLQYGFMAKQIEDAAPNLVINTIIPAVFNSEGNIVTPARPVKMYNPMGILPLLVAGYQELKASNDNLQQQMAICCASQGGRFGNNNTPTPPSDKTTVTGSIELENINTLQLFSADPNPFSESTWIRWNIPDDFQNATIYFYDNTGAKINQFKIENKGAGEIQVFGSKLSSGVYSYSLIIDNKIIDSKKMVRTK